ncbi:diacylglycerol/lipid kinase family protein [Sphingobium sp. B12D2B]|uniref:diacylglycerol/lipid kinase family protein n=1 Tax=Sphingobium sp. B12D2B TaxID=2940577 RepID=UPI0022250F34|nr:diacylglycerol kinase family protein [Sphingobium sp. B12D2B]MCW2348731.1 diacylglycerol kinase family enzyme [Sphingobium sp. B12D2B]
MSDSLFIYNERSGTCDPALVSAIQAAFAQAGRPIGTARPIDDGPLPNAAQARERGIGLVIILGGDGSLASTAQALAGWDGTLLALPGGTMNLLAHRLHGNLDPLAIAKAYLADKGTVMAVPVIEADEITAYTGIIVGPTAAWGNVREALRNHDLAALAEKVPEAITATFEAPAVSLVGDPRDYPAIFVEPAKQGLHAYGVLARNAGELFAHGWAWLSGDFRNGPSESLGAADHLEIESAGKTLDLLVDGEKATTKAPFNLRSAQSGVRFFAAQGDAGWR